MPQLVWFVTGCSTGFGAEFAKAILAKGDYVIATARNVQNLDGLKAMGATTMQLDVNEPFPNIREKVQQALGIYGRIDVLLSNAGYAELTNTLSEHLQTNTIATLNLIAALMPHWREQKSGYIVANSSINAWWEIVPAAGSYSASKSALDQLLKTFVAELKTEGIDYIKTLIINPGYFVSEVAKPQKHERALGADWGEYPALKKMCTDLVPTLHGNQPGDTAKAARLVIDLVKGEGVGQGRELPLALPIGNDAFVKIKEQTEATLRMLDEWEDVIRSTDRQM
ncbi:hypothetical protein KC343_g5316 [Hortaea werneckii]|uniref:Uncharacterized protein n=1 Tax=Hortaea werneckii TaxID=91943 RepID=A0A3M7BF91_HORWE|nr:hypothetical protein KC323_g8342 [Hortaea werneckii]KAI7152544.1 hypothetical protein KC352_g28104 [Hortaea werneckii]KAI7566588.1 hypothetical protein KC317_g5570 [Hortaea werneckii]KAI7618138.1 hypothetical protein KC346_g5147 [Hortaea werneckii]KAI7629287.1 hypothetical protein KC343_g5316 [Hortaea werneckii]